MPPAFGHARSCAERNFQVKIRWVGHSVVGTGEIRDLLACERVRYRRSESCKSTTPEPWLPDVGLLQPWVVFTGVS